MSGGPLAWVDGRFVHYLYMPTVTLKRGRYQTKLYRTSSRSYAGVF